MVFNRTVMRFLVLGLIGICLFAGGSSSLYFNGSRIGEIEPDGDVYYKGSRVGEAAGVKKEWAAGFFFFFFWDLETGKVRTH